MRTAALTGALVVVSMRLAAAAPPVPRLNDLLGPPSGGPTAVGSAEIGTQVYLFATPDCQGRAVARQPVIDGTFAIPFPAPAFDTEYSVHAVDGTGTSACSPPLAYHVIHGECPVVPRDRPVTRPPRAGKFSPPNLLPDFVHGPGNDYAKFMQHLQAEKPALTWIGGFPLFHHHLTGGVIPGVAAGGDPIAGDGITTTLEPYMLQGTLSPADGLVRKHYLEQYLATIRPYTHAGVYADLGTQVYSNVERTAGLWDFIGQWGDFAATFDLGTETPPPVDEWLRRSWDPSYMYPMSCAPPDMVGLTFDYCPDRGNGWRRFAMNKLSDGFRIFWTQVLRWMAKVGYGLIYLDNVYDQLCWNDECEAGYLEWVQARFSPAEIDRYLTRTLSRVTDDASFDSWSGGPGAWQIAGGVPVLPLYGGTVAPDVDAVRGRYALRIDADDDGGAKVWLTLDGNANAYQLGLQYRTDCPAATMRIDVYGDTSAGSQAVWTSSVSLPTASTWTALQAPFTVPSGAFVPPQIHLDVIGHGTCKVWLDDVTAVYDSESPTSVVRLWRSNETSALQLARSEAYRYWDSIPDQVLPNLLAPARAIDPDLWVLTNSGGTQRRDTNAFFIERALLESERGMVGPGSAPGTYPAVTGCSVNPVAELRCLNVGGECSCIGGDPITSATTVTNVLDYKVSASRRRADEFAYVFHLVDRFGDHYVHQPSSATLALAEAAAFGGGALADLGFDDLFGVYDTPAGDALRQLKNGFMQWAGDNAALFTCVASSAPVGIVDHDHGEALNNGPELAMIAVANELGAAGIPYDVVGAGGTTLYNLQNYRVLVYDGVPRIGTAELEVLQQYLAAGGIVIARENPAAYDEYFRRWDAHPAPQWPPVTLVPGQTVYPVGAGTFVWQPGPVTAADVLSVFPLASAFPVLPATPVRAAYWTAPDRVVAHVLNYGTPPGWRDGSVPPPQPTLTGLQVRIPTPGLVPTTAEVFSPDGASTTGPVPFVTSGGLTTVTLPQLSVYAVVRLQ